MRCIVEISIFAQKQLKKLPQSILDNLYTWTNAVESRGIFEVRKIKGYHDEPLKGHRKGERSVRLNRSYRLIYEQKESETVVVIGVLEVNKHDY